MLANTKNNTNNNTNNNTSNTISFILDILFPFILSLFPLVSFLYRNS